MTHPSPLLTVTEAAVYLRYSSSKIYKLLEKRELQFTRRGRIYLIHINSLNDYIAAHLMN
ncbi:MAG: helix-turn-helix domain-containing protein [Selenomonadaceae bacterium]